MTFGPVSAIVRPGATITAAIVGPRGPAGKDGQSIVGPVAWLPAVPWATLSSYVIGPPASLVTIGGSSFVARVPHTATTFLADWNSGFWAQIASVGATGAPGSVWYNGIGVPGTTIGVAGDYYLQADTGDVFQRSANSWGQPVANLKGLKGDTGTAGNTIRTGTGAPPATTGVNGDFYLDNTPGAPVLWGPKAGGAWPSSGTSLVGPSGPGTGDMLSPAAGSVKPGQAAVFGADNKHMVGATRTARGDAAYTIQATDAVVAVTVALTAPRTFTLPAANSVAAGAQVSVVDEAGGVSATNTLLVARAGTDTINGGASATIASAYGYLVLESDGASRWTVVDGPAVAGTAAGTFAAGNDSRIVNAASTAALAAGLATVPALTDWRQGLIELAKTRTWLGQIGAYADGFFDQSAVDVSGSVNATYDAANKLYSNPDPYTKLLMHFDSSTTADDTGHTVTATGSPAVSAAQSKFGGSSLSLNGSSYLTVAPTNADITLSSTGTWTVEGWIYIPTTNASYEILGGTGINWYVDSGGAYYFNNGSSGNLASNTSVTAGVWHKVEIGCSAGNLYMFLDGALVASGAMQTSAGGGNLLIGASNGGGNNFKGYIDEFRISMGVCRHTAAYTPETVPFSLSPPALDLRSAALPLPFTPTKGSLFVILNPLVGTVTPQSTLIGSISQNGSAGSPTYTQAPLALSATTVKGYPIYEANGFALTGSGQSLKIRLQTTAGTGVLVLGIYAKVTS